MIAESIPEAYDPLGRKVVRPDLRRRGIHPTFPMGRYVSHPLTVTCKSIEDIRKFLLSCKGVSDKEQFDRDDYWQPPEQFERTKKGDCDDFALWTWRQFVALGYDARFVAGRHGRYGVGHAWVEFLENGKCFVVEPQLRAIGLKMPRLTTLRYHPKMSVTWDGSKISFYSHDDRAFSPSLLQLVPFVAEWSIFWSSFWIRLLPRIPGVYARRAAAFLSRKATS